MSLAAALNVVSDRIHRLPLAIVYVTERCSSKCAGCDFWRHGTAELALDRARSLAGELSRLGTEMVLFTGGEPLFHSRWEDVARAFRDRDLDLWLLTSGVSLARDRAAVGALCSRVTVSFDGATPETYRATRGVDAFEAVVEGVRGLVADGVWVSLRTTVSKKNFREMPAIARWARQLGVREVSFLPVDVRSRVAFFREEGASIEDLALDPSELPVLESVLDDVERERERSARRSRVAEPFRIAESSEKLRRLHTYFAALAGLSELPPVRCNAPRFSAVVRPDGSVQPCHFIEGLSGGVGSVPTLAESLNDDGLVDIRRAIRKGAREECTACVCPMRKSTRELVRSLRFGA